MSYESRKAETAALLAHIEEVVSGHDLQRSSEEAPGQVEAEWVATFAVFGRFGEAVQAAIVPAKAAHRRKYAR